MTPTNQSPIVIPWGYMYEPFGPNGTMIVPDVSILTNISDEQLISDFRDKNPEFLDAFRSKNYTGLSGVTLDDAIGAERINLLTPPLEALFTLAYGLSEKPYDSLMWIDLRTRVSDIIVPSMIRVPAKAVLSSERETYFTRRYLVA